MLPTIVRLGLVPVQEQILAWLVRSAAPIIRTLVADPAGSLHRVSDVLVWDGPAGHRVLATLEGMGENQARIDGAVQHIETAQLVMAGGIGAVATVSLFHVGLTALVAGLMLKRVAALQRRLDDLSRNIRGIQQHLDAMTQAWIESAVKALEQYERSPANRADELKRAKDKSDDAIGVYKRLILAEAGGDRRLAVLNHCGRCYALALLTHARCMVLAGAAEDAQHTLDGERDTLKELAPACPTDSEKPPSLTT